MRRVLTEVMPKGARAIGRAAEMRSAFCRESFHSVKNYSTFPSAFRGFAKEVGQEVAKSYAQDKFESFAKDVIDNGKSISEAVKSMVQPEMDAYERVKEQVPAAIEGMKSELPSLTDAVVKEFCSFHTDLNISIDDNFSGPDTALKF